MDAWFTLSKTLKLSGIVPPVGTHAHELSMVFMSLFPELDGNEERIAYSQALAHSMYYRLVHQGYAGPMPMLPDTLGTPAFLKAAESFMVTPMLNGELQRESAKVSLLSVINSARQDSGTLVAFKSALAMYPFKGTMMASEIDSKEDLVEAASQGYATFGAGGFMGDSEKVWNVNADKFSASMAVKAVRVYVDGRRTAVQPVKLGDSEDTSKVTCDAALPQQKYRKIVEAAKDVKNTAIEQPHARGAMEVDDSFNCTKVSSGRVSGSDM
jgi:nicotinic acid phosphoribosyltransferase